METKEKKTELKLTLAGIHKLYIDGKISLAKHNEWCLKACDGCTVFTI